VLKPEGIEMNNRNLSVTIGIVVAAALASAPAAGHDSVFSVKGSGGSGAGFLADRSGLVVTANHLVAGGRYVAVTVAPDRIVAAELLARDERNGVATIRVHPDAVAGVEPLRLACDVPPAGPAHRGDAIRLPLDSSSDGPPREGTIRKFKKRRIVHDVFVDFDNYGAPLLDADGRVVGVAAAKSIPIGLLEPMLLEAIRTAAEQAPPSAALLTVASEHVYPLDSMRPVVESGLDAKMYRIRVEKISLEFLTPPLIETLPGDPVSYSYGADDGFFDWKRYAGMVAPEVVVQAVPRLRASSAYKAKLAGTTVYWVAYPALFLLAAFGGANEPPPLLGPPNKSYRIGSAFHELQLYRGDVRVEPLETEAICGKRRMLVQHKPGKEPKLRKVGGCYAAYHFPPEAFAPGQAVAIHLFRSKSKQPEIVELENLQDRLWQDFVPYVEARHEAGVTDSLSSRAAAVGSP
jgi:hypothetical protein